MNPHFNEIGQNFAKVYYETFDRNRAELAPLYNEHSMMTFEGDAFQGTAKIVEKLVSLPIQRVQHAITKVDCQPTVANSVVIHVLGQQKADEDHPMSFSQSFVLVPTPEGSYVVINDVFRLTVHDG